MIQPLLDAGALDIAISALTAYQMLGQPGQVGVCAFTYGALDTLELLLGSEKARPIVMEKLRSAGKDGFRHMLDNPLTHIGDMGFETGMQGTKIAALVRGTLHVFLPLCSLCAQLETSVSTTGLGQRRRRWRPNFQSS